MWEGIPSLSKDPSQRRDHPEHPNGDGSRIGRDPSSSQRPFPKETSRWSWIQHGCGGGGDRVTVGAPEVEFMESWIHGMVGAGKVPESHPVPPHPWAGTPSVIPGGSNTALDIPRDGGAAPGQQLEGLNSVGMGENLGRGKGSVCGSNPWRTSEGGWVQLIQNIPIFRGS